MRRLLGSSLKLPVAACVGAGFVNYMAQKASRSAVLPGAGSFSAAAPAPSAGFATTSLLPTAPISGTWAAQGCVRVMACATRKARRSHARAEAFTWRSAALAVCLLNKVLLGDVVKDLVHLHIVFDARAVQLDS